MKDAYDGVIKTGCRGCHAQLSPSLRTRSQFQSYINSGTIKSYVCDRGVMPLALRTYENFWLADAPGLYGPEVLSGFLPGPAGGACSSVGPGATTAGSLTIDATSLAAEPPTDVDIARDLP